MPVSYYVAARYQINANPDNDRYKLIQLREGRPEQLSAGISPHRDSHIRDARFAHFLRDTIHTGDDAILFLYREQGPEGVATLNNLIHMGAHTGGAVVFIWSQGQWYIMSRQLDRCIPLDRYLPSPAQPARGAHAAAH